MEPINREEGKQLIETALMLNLGLAIVAARIPDLLLRRSMLALVGLSLTVLFTFLYCDWAIEGRGTRRFLGFALCGFGFLCGLAGTGLLFLTGSSWTWGWWL